MYTSIKVWQELEKDDSEFSFTAAVTGVHVYRSQWLPHLGQRLNTEREHGNAEDRFVITVREHRVTLVRSIIIDCSDNYSEYGSGSVWMKYC